MPATVSSRLAQLLTQRSLHIATAESCTLGGICSALGAIPGASSYLQGGIVAYQTGLKTELLGVSAELIQAHHVVSPEVAEALALGATERLDAEVGIGTTGLAGPGGGEPLHPVGQVCIASVYRSRDGLHTRSKTLQLQGSREENIQQAIHEALQLTLELLEAHP